MKTNEVTITVAGLPNTAKGLIAVVIADALKAFGMEVSICNDPRDGPVQENIGIEQARDTLKSYQITEFNKFNVQIKQQHLSKFKSEELKWK